MPAPGSATDEPSPDLTFGIPSRSRVLSSTVEPFVASQAGVLLPYRRWAALIALLLGEIIALTVSFDGASIARGAGWWSSLLVRSSQLPQVAVATVVAALLFGGSRLRPSCCGISIKKTDRTDSGSRS